MTNQSATELQFVCVSCPWCGETFEISADGSAGSQRYIEDCAVCCQPIDIALSVDDDGDIAVCLSTERD
ncbi:MAG: CPXCG motif-containing cysteine-rich protein [Rhodanobacteraceae bacterium]